MCYKKEKIILKYFTTHVCKYALPQKHGNSILVCWSIAVDKAYKFHCLQQNIVRVGFMIQVLIEYLFELQFDDRWEVETHFHLG